MRRDSRDLEIHTGDRSEDGALPGRPTLSVHCYDETDAVGARVNRGNGEVLTGTDLDVAFRFQTSTKVDESTGILSVTDRTTGAFIVEVPTSSRPIVEFVRVARRNGDTATDSTYAIRLLLDNDPVVVDEKRAFLVYAADGTLLRHCSLIPADIEI